MNKHENAHQIACENAGSLNPVNGRPWPYLGDSRKEQDRKREVRRMTKDEHERMLDLCASWPLTKRPVDDALMASGFVVPYDDGYDTGAVMPNWERWGSNLEHLLESDGRMREDLRPE